MPYDAQVELRVDSLSEGIPFEKKKMFGGIGYLLNGNMAVGVWKEYLIVRCGTEAWESCLSDPHAREFDITGKSMKGWIMLHPEGFRTEGQLQQWIEIGQAFASSLPAK